MTPIQNTKKELVEELKTLQIKQGLNLSGEDEGAWQIHEESKSFLLSAVDRLEAQVLEGVREKVDKYFGGITEGTSRFYTTGDANESIEKFVKEISLLTPQSGDESSKEK